jgi:hypothetical protein
LAPERPEMASSGNIQARLIGANCAMPRRESLVRVNVGWNCVLRPRRMHFRAKVCLPMAIVVRRCCSIRRGGGNRPGWSRTNSPAASYRSFVAAFTVRSPTKSVSLTTPTGSRE